MCKNIDPLVNTTTLLGRPLSSAVKDLLGRAAQLLDPGPLPPKVADLIQPRPTSTATNEDLDHEN